jgi:acetate kinase
VFTGGIGENSERLRASVLDGMGWLGIALDPQANAARGPLISKSDSAVRAFVIKTDEEAMIAQHTMRAAGLAAASHAA